jgi:site-specific recombinase XerD
MANELQTTDRGALAPGRKTLTEIVQTVIEGIGNKHTRRAYERALQDFLAWYENTGRQEMSKATVAAYANALQDGGYSAASIRQRLAAVTRLAQEAADSAGLPEWVVNGIRRVERPKSKGERLGNWLTLEQAQALIDAPDQDSLKGARDRAILGVMIGAGLRRSEVAGLEVGDLQQRDGRWVILDLHGKHGRTRTIPVPIWTMALLARWTAKAEITAGPIFRPITRWGTLQEGGITPQAVYDVIKTYRNEIGQPKLAAHDLRRTFAHLARTGGGDLEQLRLVLGHNSLETTQRYLGTKLDLTKTPGDSIKIHV